MSRQTERKGGSGLAGGITESGAGARRHNKQLALALLLLLLAMRYCTILGINKGVGDS